MENATTAGLPMSYKLGPHWDDVITWSDFISETILDSSAQTARDNVLDFLYDLKTILFGQFLCFLFFVSVSCLTKF